MAEIVGVVTVLFSAFRYYDQLAAMESKLPISDSQVGRYYVLPRRASVFLLFISSLDSHQVHLVRRVR